MTLRALSRAVDVDHAHLSRVLHGKPGKKVSTALAGRIATALDLPRDFFAEYREGVVVEAVRGDGILRDRLYDRLNRN